MNIKKIIKEVIEDHSVYKNGLLLEKRILQMTSTIEVTLSMDLIKNSGHVDHRSKGSGRESIEDYDMRPVTNEELKYFVSNFKRDIAEKLISGEIGDQESFVVKSPSKGLALVLKALHVDGMYWQIVIVTVWRESETHVLKTYKDQVVIIK